MLLIVAHSCHLNHEHDAAHGCDGNCVHGTNRRTHAYLLFNSHHVGMVQLGRQTHYAMQNSMIWCSQLQRVHGDVAAMLIAIGADASTAFSRCCPCCCCFSNVHVRGRPRTNQPPGEVRNLTVLTVCASSASRRLTRSCHSRMVHSWFNV
jgi:hypothetical protein